MRVLKVYDENKLDIETCQQIYSLIQNGFLERWGVKRFDVSIESIQNRINAIALDNGKMLGVLGLEQSGEFVNGCSIKSINGIYLLASLAKEIVRIHSKKIHLYFAFFPKIDIAIPLSCYIATKGYLSVSSEIVTKIYDEKEITFKRIDLYTKTKISKQEFLNMLKK